MIAILAEGLRVDLVVKGTIARTGISGLIIGNTAGSILDQLTCSVLAINLLGF
jgi:nucleotide-binding universal stress UspA family protein